MKWIDVSKRLPKDKEVVLFWVKWDDTIWHAKTGWVKWDGHLIVIPQEQGKTGREVKYWTKITPPNGLLKCPE